MQHCCKYNQEVIFLHHCCIYIFLTMTKVLLGFQLVVSLLIHLFCCGLPLVMSISGGLSIFIGIQTFMPVLFYCQLVFFGVSFYLLYYTSGRKSKSGKLQRIVLWVVSSISVVFYFYPPAHWFKSEEDRLKQAQMVRFFKSKNL